MQVTSNERSQENSLQKIREKALIDFMKYSSWGELAGYVEKILRRKSFIPRLPFPEGEPHKNLSGIYKLLDFKNEVEIRNKYASFLINFYSSEVNKSNSEEFIFELLETISLIEPRVNETGVILTHFMERVLKNRNYGAINLHDHLLAVLCHAPFIECWQVKEEILKDLLSSSQHYQKVALRFLMLREFTSLYWHYFNLLTEKAEKNEGNPLFLIESLFEFSNYKNNYKILYEWVKDNLDRETVTIKSMVKLIDSRLTYPWIEKEKFALLTKLKIHHNKTLPTIFVIDLIISVLPEITNTLIQNISESSSYENLIGKHFFINTNNYKVDTLANGLIVSEEFINNNKTVWDETLLSFGVNHEAAFQALKLNTNIMAAILFIKEKIEEEIKS